jgi:hypothetical protein
MSDGHRDTPSQAGDAGVFPISEHTAQIFALAKNSHWVSSRMGAPAEPLLQYAAPNFEQADVEQADAAIEPVTTQSGDSQSGEAPDLVARLEALKQLLDAAKEQELPVIDPSTDSGHIETGAAMPKFLLDPQAQEQNVEPHTEHAAGETWLGKIKAATGPDRAQWIFFFATIIGSATLLLGLEYFDLGRPNIQLPTPKIAQVDPAPPEERLNFMSEATCATPPCDALSTAISRTIATIPVDPAQSAGPGIVYATNPNMAVDDHRSTIDPLDEVTVRGLPSSVRLSVGQKTSDTEWTLAAGDLSNIGIVVPSDYAEPIQATIEIRKREGEPLAALGLTIQRDTPVAAAEIPASAPVEPAPIDPLLSMAPIDPAVMDGDDKIEDGNSDRPENKAAPASSAAAKSVKPAKAKVRQKKQKPAQAPTQAVAETVKPPATLLQGLFQSSSTPETPPAATAFTGNETATSSANDNPIPVPLPPSATVANQPAGFETLRGLGGGFGLQPE